jgi:DNA-binding GntR family transcriptional regulator
MMKENNKTSSKSIAYEDLRYRIITQELPPGELLKEKELIAHYQIGRTPLREIFIELQRQGLIRSVPRSGTWVAPLDLNFVKQIAEVRLPLEKLAGELSTERITAGQIELLEQILGKAESDQSFDDVTLQELIKYESRFHHILYSATCNAKLEELLVEFQAICSRLWHSVFFTRKRLKKMFEDQRGVLNALKKGNGKLCGELLVKHTQSYFDGIDGFSNL